MKAVFISHSSSDAKAAKTICAAIEARGIKCWIASRDVGPGGNFQREIVKAISNGSALVLVFSEHCNNSDEILRELTLASQNRLLVVPVRIEDVLPKGPFQYELATRQWIDVYKDWEIAIGKIVEALQAASRSETMQAPQSPGPGLIHSSMPWNLNHWLTRRRRRAAWAVGVGVTVAVAAALYFSRRLPPALRFPEAGPETAEYRVTQFVTHVIIGGPPPVPRYWSRVTPDRWVEVYPDGTRETLNVVRRMIMQGCAGTVVENAENAGNYAFILDRGCPSGMPFRISHGGGGWGRAGEMTEVK